MHKILVIKEFVKINAQDKRAREFDVKVFFRLKKLEPKKRRKSGEVGKN